MRIIQRLFNKYHEKWAIEKFNIFLEYITLKKGETILDLGGGNGSYMDRFGSALNNYSVVVADICEEDLKIAREKGYNIICLDSANNKLPFKDKQINCIFCNSVIEHVTIPKDQLWSKESNSNEFARISIAIQKKFATEIIRCSKKYYVQTPHKYFPIESHSWFPFLGYMGRRTQLRLLKLINKFWIKKTQPDWNLLTEIDMQVLFPDAEIFVNKKFGFKKEIIAIKR
jgi:hypothetical protein